MSEKQFKYWLSYLDDLGLTLEEMKLVNRWVEEIELVETSNPITGQS